MKTLLLGLGRANLAVARYLLKRGDDVALYEDHMEMLSDRARELLESSEIKMYQKNNYELVISSPGFPMDKEVIQWLKAQDIPIIDEVEFAYQQLKNPKIIAVTGTNGKSTTVSLISSILNAAGVRNFLGGNISPGEPFSSALLQPAFEYYVLEVSSFQLMRIERFHPRIAIITNISRDHLNWHRDFDEYKAAKFSIFRNQDNQDYAVLNYEDEHIQNVLKDIQAQVIFFGYNAKKGAWLNSDFCYQDERLFSVRKSRLTGRHNMMNALAAIAVAKILNIDTQMIEKGLATFETLPHRLEDIGTIRGIRYINNSMCTNEDAAIASFRAIPGTKIVILGGKQKGDRGENYLALLTKEAKACVILGDNAPYIMDYFRSKEFDKFDSAQDMDDAVRKARAFSIPGDTILLNPGFASFDYFSNFEERGEAFKHAAHRD